MESEREQYNNGEARLKTFQKWTLPEDFVSPQALADSGLFFTGHLDRVRCFSCGGELQDWIQGDDPVADHKKYYPHCSFINSYRPTENTSADSATPKPSLLLNQEDSCQMRPPNIVNTEALMHTCPYDYDGVTTCDAVMTERPYSTLDARLQTFKSPTPWPKASPSAHKLAEAGFCYTGNGDAVECFSCKGTLENWGTQDNPIEDHKEFFPECQFIQKGY